VGPRSWTIRCRCLTLFDSLKVCNGWHGSSCSGYPEFGRTQNIISGSKSPSVLYAPSDCLKIRRILSWDLHITEMRFLGRMEM
jgi:hypothetical protein